MDFRRALRRAAEQERSVCIERRDSGWPKVYGFPLVVSRALVLLHNVVDFDLDGFSILPLADIEAVRSRDGERFVEQVLRDEGQLRASRQVHFPIAVGGWGEVFTALGAVGEIAIIEREAQPDGFCIGVVGAIAADSVGLLQFNTSAVWDSSPTIVGFDDITRVRFNERYTRVFSRYLPGAATR